MRPLAPSNFCLWSKNARMQKCEKAKANSYELKCNTCVLKKRSHFEINMIVPKYVWCQYLVLRMRYE